MTEAELQSLVLAACRRLGMLAYHTHDSRRSVAGFPDLCIVGKRVLFRELKAEKGRVSDEQEEWISRLARGGADVGVWRPADWPARIVAELRAAAGPNVADK